MKTMQALFLRSQSQFKTRVFLVVIQPLTLAVFNSAQRRPMSQSSFQCFQVFLFALSNDFDLSVVEITDPAFDSQVLCLIFGPRSKIHALDFTRDETMQALDHQKPPCDELYEKMNIKKAKGSGQRAGGKISPLVPYTSFFVLC